MNTIYECKVIRLVRLLESKNIENKKGKIIQIHEREEYDAFISRVETTINQYSSEGWCIITSNYNVPISEGGSGGYSNYNSAEFVFVLQRQKQF